MILFCSKLNYLYVCLCSMKGLQAAAYREEPTVGFLPGTKQQTGKFSNYLVNSGAFSILLFIRYFPQGLV